MEVADAAPTEEAAGVGRCIQARTWLIIVIIIIIYTTIITWLMLTTYTSS